MGGRVGLFGEWGRLHRNCLLEEQRLEYRELLGEMAIYEEDLNGAELKHYNNLATIAWCEHDETEDAERELRISEMEHAGSFTSVPYAKCCSSKARQTDKETREEETEMSGWFSSTPPCTKSDPTWGTEEWRWGGEVGGENGRPHPHRADGALLSRRPQCRPRRAAADS